MTTHGDIYDSQGRYIGPGTIRSRGGGGCGGLVAVLIVALVIAVLFVGTVVGAFESLINGIRHGFFTPDWHAAQLKSCIVGTWDASGVTYRYSNRTETTPDGRTLDGRTGTIDYGRRGKIKFYYKIDEGLLWYVGMQTSSASLQRKEIQHFQHDPKWYQKYKITCNETTLIEDRYQNAAPNKHEIIKMKRISKTA
jgi:hypothetical protein